MKIITISRGSQCHGEEFAKKLAKKLGYLCVNREEILKEANKLKIPISKLETAITKPHIFSEELALELENYKALAASYICEKALNNNIIYNGRVGHKFLPGVDHILKIRVIADFESRVERVMQNFSLSREKARQYIEQLDQNEKKWVQRYYRVDWDDSSLYDIVINLSLINIDNAATAVCSIAQLPEFQATPVIIKSIQNLHLASKAQLILATDKRTCHLNIKTRANNEVVYITYLAQQVEDANRIIDVLSKFKIAKEIICTQAETNILWIQEKFNTEDNSYNDILKLANKWDAAVELIQIKPSAKIEIIEQDIKTNKIGMGLHYNKGSKDNTENVYMDNMDGMLKIYENLIKDGSAGGKRIIFGSEKTLINTIDLRIPYRLIVLDNIFVSKGKATQIRKLREWSNYINENLKIPVLSIDEIRIKYRFGFKDILQMILFALLTASVVFITFTYNDLILSYLSHKGIGWRILVTTTIFSFVPFFAYLYSSATKLFFKMIKLE